MVRVLMCCLAVGGLGCLEATAAEPPRTIDPQVAQRVAGNTEFGCRLYAALTAEVGDEANLAFSPLSVSLALAMTYAGARGQTADELRAALRLPEPPAQAHAALAVLRRSLVSDGPDAPHTLLIANRLWCRRGRPLESAFLELTRRDYDAPASEVDFAGNPEGARIEINNWIEAQTRQHIRDLLPAGAINNRTALVLANAMFFKGDWNAPFEASLTSDRPFHVSAAKEAAVPTMHQPQVRLRYARTDGAEMLELPYRGEQTSLLIVLPAADVRLRQFEASFTPARLAALVRGLESKMVEVWLPKFTVRTQQSIVAPLKAMGVEQAFTAAADFSGIDGTHDLYLSDVIHGCLVDVNETGTVAAAATAAVIGIKSALPHKDVVFRADRPFLFVLRDNATGSILFAGRVADPSPPAQR